MIRRIAALLIALGVLALSPVAAHAADDSGRDPLTLAKQRLDAARAEATDISGRISAAQTQEAKLEAEISAAEANIPQLRARATELKAIVKQRAAQLYVRYGETAAFESAMEAENAEDGLRAAHLTGTLGTQDLDAATKLRATAAELAAREADLKNQKADLEKTLASARAPERPPAEEAGGGERGSTTRCRPSSPPIRRSTASTSPPGRASAR